MRRRLAVVLLAGLVLLPLAHAWEIRRFASTITVLSDSQLDVTETIEADFFNEPRHGIYRDVPVDYLDRFGQRLGLRWTLVSVTDQHGTSYPAQLSVLGRYRHIRIGDPNVTVTGPHTYVIHYQVARAINRFSDHDELYWNATGTEWSVPIRQAEARIQLPESVSPALIQPVAFTGSYGSRAQDATVEVRENRTVRCVAPHSLNAYEGLTVVVGWPVGAIGRPSWTQQLVWWLTDNWGYGLPVLTFVGMFLLWWRRGREFPGRGSIVVEYEPPDGLRPAEIGALIDDRVDLQDITATVIDLAVRGYLAIEPVGTTLLGHPKDYRLLRRKPFREDATLLPHEQQLLEALFGKHGLTGDDSQLLSELSMKFYQDLPDIRRAIYDHLRQEGYLDSNPEQVRHQYWVAALAIAGLGIFVGLKLSGGLVATSWLIGLLLSAAIIAAFGYFMPRKTVLGRRALDQIRGFEEFLIRADRDRIVRMNPTELFERCLPYAMALGVATQWAAAFEGLYTTPPSWYAGGSPTAFSPRVFVGQLQHTTHAMASPFVSSPRTSASSGSSGFGGGGFSGGGFGGGGGGAW